MPEQITQTDGQVNIKAESLKDRQVAPDAAIQESKLDLAHSTTDLFNNSIRTDESRTVADGVNIVLPYLILKDTVLADTYWKVTAENGELLLTQVEL